MSPSKNEFNIRGWLEDFQKKPGGMWLLLGMTGLGLALLLSGGRGSPVKEKISAEPVLEQSVTNNIFQLEKNLERELAGILQQVAGAGTVAVKIHLKSGNRQIWERQVKISRRSQQQNNEVNTEESRSDELVLASGRDGRAEPIRKEEVAPEIEGVVVVATGANDLRVKQWLTDMVMTVLNLPPHRVIVVAGSETHGLKGE